MPVLLDPAAPVPGFPFEYRWFQELIDVFDLQIELIREDIARARAEDKVIIYLSCPISSRGGGNSAANVEIARFTQLKLLRKLGHRFWFLNPAVYQMESKEGTGLMRKHARQLGIDPDTLPRPSGGDYMRMWTKILVEETLPRSLWKETKPPEVPCLGGAFDAFYFLGPSDMHAFFAEGQSNVPLTDAVEQYFARKFALDPDFRDFYSQPAGINWGALVKDIKPDDLLARDKWELTRKEFFRFYALRASVGYSLGSHDEWNIFLELNRRRMVAGKTNDGLAVWDQLSGWFEGQQVAPGAASVPVAKGYQT